MIPVEYLEFVARVVTDDEEACAEQIEIEAMTDKSRQAINGLSQISIAISQIDGRSVGRG